MMITCPVCGKLTCIHWPEHWVYRRGVTYYCSYMCMDVAATKDLKMLHEVARNRRKGKIMSDKRRRIRPEEKEKAVEIYNRDGMSAAVDYLVSIGIPNPDKCIANIKSRTISAGADPKPAPKQEEPAPAEPKKDQPLQYDGYTVRCIEGKYGKFYWDYEYNRLDWTSQDGEEVSLSPQGWKTFCTEIMPEVMAILGVPDDE